MSATSETLAIFLGLDTLALPYLIAKRRLVTPAPSRKRGATQTTARAEAEVAPAALAAQSPAQLTSVKRQTRNPRLPKLPDAAEMKNPRLAEYARGRQRDPVTGHFVPTKQAS